ncbi:MAG: hypothetical protein ACI4S4_00725 [Candidatus Ornithospirochaeta sp.]
MKRKILALVAFMIFSLSVSASSREGASLNALWASALRSPSYRGSIEDIFVNPASLPLMRNNNTFKVSVGSSEAYDTSLFGKEKAAYIQNFRNEIQGTVVSGAMALTAKFSSVLTERRLNQNQKPIFDIYTGIDIEIDLGYGIGDNFAFGFNLGGGNSMIREGKKVSSYIDVVQNALFSPYEKVMGSERFTSAVGVLVYSDNLSLGLTTSSIIASDAEGNTNFLQRILGNTTVSFSYNGNMYSKEGDLNMVVPRAGASIAGMGLGEERSITLSGDVSLQLLKNTYVDGGIKYLYSVDEEGISNIITISVLGVLDDFSLGVNLSWNLKGVQNFLPSIVFTYSN